MPRPEVRPAELEDLAAVAALQGWAGDALTATQLATWDEMLATPNLQVVVAEIDDAVVGTASLLVMSNVGYECRPTAFIEAVVVAEEARRQGVGAALLRRLLAETEARSCRKVQLLSHKRHRHDGAFAFYESLGFTAEAEGFRLYLD